VQRHRREAAHRVLEKLEAIVLINSLILSTKVIKEANHIERTEVSSFGFGRSPDSSTSSSNDHHSRLVYNYWHENNTLKWKENPRNNSVEQ
jgi:hypothetical protein